jgi:hypothetical protein
MNFVRPVSLARTLPLPPPAVLLPTDYHVTRDGRGRFVVACEDDVVGRYPTLQAAQELACSCAIADAEQGQSARVHVHLDAYSLLVFMTTDHAAAV